jgi:HEAT repeat protein
MVRAAAVISLRSEGAAVPVIVASVDDSMSLVRAAAIDVLADASQPDGWDRIHRRLRDPNEWPNVTAAAIEYVVAHCRTDAVDSLLRVVMRAAPSHALTEDLNNAALAIGALRALGTSQSRSAIELLQGTDGVPPTLKMALEKSLAEDAGCESARR